MTAAPTADAHRQPAAGGDDLAGFARGGLINLAGSVWQGLSSFVVTVMITRGLGADDLAGAFFQAIALFTILAATAKLGADTGLVRQIPHWLTQGRPGDTRLLLRIAIGPVVVLGALAGLALFALAEPLADLLGEGEGGAAVADYARAMAVLVPVGALQMTLTSASRGFGSMVPSNVTDRLLRPTLQIVALGVLLLVTDGPPAATSIALAWAGPYLIALIAVWRVVARDLRAVPDEPPTRTFGALAGEFWRFTSPRALAGFFQVAILWLDVILVGALATQAEAGIYAASVRFLIVGSFVQLAVIHAIQPRVTEALARDDLTLASRLFRTGTGWVVAAVWPLYLLLAVFAPVLLEVFGASYVEGTTALRILCAAWLIATACGPVDTVLNMSGRSGWSMIDLGAALVVNIVGNLILVPPYGMEGAAIAWGASMLVHNLAPLYQVNRFLGIHPFGRGWVLGVLGSVGAVAVGAGLAVLVLGQTIGSVVVGSLLAAVLYLAFVLRNREAIDLDALVGGVRGG